MTQRILLTADDFGLNPAVSKAVIELVKARRLSAIGCMTNMEHWDEYLPDILNCKNRVNLGLHFNLTEGYLLSSKKTAYSLKKLILKAYLRQIKIHDIETELILQIKEFQNKTGFLPHYIDGHQHIQQLPIIRTALVNVINQVWQTQKKPYVRISQCRRFLQFKNLKASMIHLLGSQKLKKLLQKNRIPFNSSFAGIYNFQPQQNYSKLFANFIEELGDQGILMCHPGLSNSYADPIAFARTAEFKFLMSDEFKKLLTKHGCVI